MVALQVAAIAFSLFMMYLTLLHYRRNELRRLEFFSWQTLWLGLIVVVLFPHLLDFALRTFRFYRVFDLIVIVGIVVALAVSFQGHVQAHRHERKIEQLTRAMAFLEGGVKASSDDEHREQQ